MNPQPDALDLLPQRLEEINEVLKKTDWQLTSRDYSSQTIWLELSHGEDSLRIHMTVEPDSEQNFVATLNLYHWSHPLIKIAGSNHSVREKMVKHGWDLRWTSDYDDGYLSGLSLTRKGQEFGPLLGKLLADYDHISQVATRIVELETQIKKIIEEL